MEVLENKQYRGLMVEQVSGWLIPSRYYLKINKSPSITYKLNPNKSPCSMKHVSSKSYDIISYFCRNCNLNQLIIISKLKKVQSYEWRLKKVDRLTWTYVHSLSLWTYSTDINESLVANVTRAKTYTKYEKERWHHLTFNLYLLTEGHLPRPSDTLSLPRM